MDLLDDIKPVSLRGLVAGINEVLKLFSVWCHTCHAARAVFWVIVMAVRRSNIMRVTNSLISSKPKLWVTLQTKISDKEMNWWMTIYLAV